MNILLAITGSISAYKAIELCRLFVKEGHNVKVILSRGALEFVKPKLFSYLGAEAVHEPMDDFKYTEGVLHVELAKWADTFLVAPLSANTLSKFAVASADDLLTSLFLAYPKEKPMLLFPAMNTQMWTNPIVQKNVETLGLLKNLFIHPPANGLLACGDEGAGKLPEIETIFHFTESFSLKQSTKNILITTGATISPLDPVRYMTNASSGKTGLFLAKEALRQGHQVKVIAGKYATTLLETLREHPNFSLERVVTTGDMEEAVGHSFKDCDIYISSAAIGDIEFDLKEGKLKKKDIGESLPIKNTTDILAKVLKEKTETQKIIGFAAETNLSFDTLNEKWSRKKVDLLVGTKVHSGLGTNSREGFGNDHASYMFFQDGKIIKESQLSKNQLPKEIFNQVQ